MLVIYTLSVCCFSPPFCLLNIVYFWYSIFSPILNFNYNCYMLMVTIEIKVFSLSYPMLHICDVWSSPGYVISRIYKNSTTISLLWVWILLNPSATTPVCYFLFLWKAVVLITIPVNLVDTIVCWDFCSFSLSF